MRVGERTPAVVAATVMRSEGQRMFMCVTGSLDAIASELGCSRQTILNWKTGSKLPSSNARARVQEAYGIPARAWAVLPGAPLIDVAPATVDGSTSAPTTLEDCLALLDVLRRDRMQPTLMPAERVKLADAEARILALRARLEQAAEFAEARYVANHPSWLRLRRELVEALEPHPLAAQAVIAALAKLERER